jgi:N-acetyl-anhydromuramyl-L-alanine amidase AmpD
MAVPKPACDTGHRSPNAGGYSATRKVQAWCVHITDGTNSLGWLTSPVSQASANYLMRRDGYLYELVPPDISPWTNGDVQRPDLGNPLIAAWVKAGTNPNTRCLTVECEGKSTHWNPGALTKAQEEALVALLAWGCDAYGLTADATHILRHSQINSVTRLNCPGFSSAEWAAYIAATAQRLGQGTPPAGGQTVPVPAAGTAESVLVGGVPVSVINWGGAATAIDGTAYVDLGITVTSKDGTYSRSLINGAMQPWVKVG